MNLNDRLSSYKSKIDSELERQLTLESNWPPQIGEAMIYSVLNGGKRLRPILAIVTGEMYGEKLENLLPVCAPLEFIQSFTLIHDDLPCMDDAAFRRGKPSVHIAYGEALAVLTGDALLNLAFGAIAREGNKRFANESILKVIIELSEALGVDGVMGGQVLDLNPSAFKDDLKGLFRMHQMKTAKFFKASLRMGAILAKAPEKDLEKLTSYSMEFGLVFQITDDILDATGTIEEVGKDVERDANLDRMNYVLAYGLDGARKEAEKASDRAKQALQSLPNTDFLKTLVEFLLERKK